MPRKQMRGKKRAPRTRVPRGKKYGNETAAITEVYEFALLNSNTAYIDYQVSLARHARATAVAQGFREFRITKLEYKFKPAYDTFAAYGATNATLPYLYAMVDKQGVLADFTTCDQLRMLGCKPRRLDDKTLSVSFKPAVLQYALDKNNATNPWAVSKVSPWLSTDKNNDVVAGMSWAPSSIDHLGLAWFVETTANTTTPIAYNLEVVAHFQFRKPNIIKPPAGQDAEEAVLIPATQVS